MNHAETVAHLRSVHGWNDTSLAALVEQERTAAQGHADEHASGAPLGHIHLESARVVARITPEAWVDDNAVEVDPPGPTEWDATAHAEAHADYVQRMFADAPEAWNGGTALDNDDVFADDPNAPQWVREWDGPFTIHLLLMPHDDADPLAINLGHSRRTGRTWAATQMFASGAVLVDGDGNVVGTPADDELGDCRRCGVALHPDDAGRPVDADDNPDCLNANLPYGYNGDTRHVPSGTDTDLLAHLADDHGIDPAQVEPGSEQAWHDDDHTSGDHHGHTHPGHADAADVASSLAAADDADRGFGMVELHTMFGSPDEGKTVMRVRRQEVNSDVPDFSARERGKERRVASDPVAEDASGYDLTPTQREVAVEHVKVLLDVSKREAATVVDIIADTGTYVAEGVDTDLLLHVVDAAVNGRGHDMRAVAAMLVAMGVDAKADTHAASGSGVVWFGGRTFEERYGWDGREVHHHVTGKVDVEVPDANPRRAAKVLRRLVADA